MTVNYNSMMAGALFAFALQSSTVTYADQAADPLTNPSIVSPLSERLMASKVVRNGERLVTVGERGTILISIDNAKTWRQVLSPVRVTLTSLMFADSQNGWAVGNGGIVLGTRDGGENWTKLLDGNAAAAIEDEAARKASDAAPGNDALKHRLGEAEGLVKDGPDKPFTDIKFFDSANGIVIGAYGLSFRTDDGGATWHSLMGDMDNPYGRHLYSMCLGRDGLFVVGEQGSVFRSTNGGATFKRLRPVGKGTLFGILSTSKGTLVTYGLRGALFRSVDNGENWTRIESSQATITGGKVLSDGAIILIKEDGRIFKSNDEAQTFDILPVSSSMTLSSVDEISPDRLILSGVRGTVTVNIEKQKEELSK